MWPFKKEPEPVIESPKTIPSIIKKFKDDAWVSFKTPDGIKNGQIRGNTRSSWDVVYENYDPRYPDYPIFINDGQNITVNVKEEEIIGEIEKPEWISLFGIYIIIDDLHELSVAEFPNNSSPIMTLLDQLSHGEFYFPKGRSKAVDIKFESYCSAFDYLFENERKISKCDPTIRLSRASIVEKIRRAQLKDQE